MVNQVVDYRQVKSVSGFLTETFGKAPFDAILDTIGSQELFIKSPGYLKSDGIVVNVGEGNREAGQLSFILQALRNTHQPSFLGGVPRKYITFSAPLTGANAERLASLAEEGKMRVFIDSSFNFKDALKASRLSISILCESTDTATRPTSDSAAQILEEGS